MTGYEMVSQIFVNSSHASLVKDSSSRSRTNISPPKSPEAAIKIRQEVGLCWDFEVCHGLCIALRSMCSTRFPRAPGEAEN